MCCEQGVTKRCRLSWLTNSALVNEPKCEGRGGVVGSRPMSTGEGLVSIGLEEAGKMRLFLGQIIEPSGVQAIVCGLL